MRIQDARGLTISGPFGLLIAEGIKLIELRSWETRYRGLVFLHVGTSTDYDAYYEALEIDPDECPKSSLVGAATLRDCIVYSNAELWARDADKHKWMGDEPYEEIRQEYYSGKPPIGHLFSDHILFDEPIRDVKPGDRFYWAATKPGQIQGFERAIAQIQAKRLLDLAGEPLIKAEHGA